MKATMTKIGEGAFADVYGCQKDDWKKVAIKVSKEIVPTISSQQVGFSVISGSHSVGETRV